MSLDAFYPGTGNTSVVQATTTATTAFQPSSGSHSGSRIACIGSVVAYIAVGSSDVTAVAPTTSTPSNGIPLLPNSAETFSLKPNYYLSAITTSGTALIYMTPGMGM